MIEDPVVREKAEAQWQADMEALSTMPAPEAFQFIIYQIFPQAEQFQGYQLKQTARDQNQVAQDKSLVNDEESQFIQYGNDQKQIDAGGDTTQLQADQNQCLINAQEDAAQLDYDLNNAPVYAGQDQFVSSIESDQETILPDTSSWEQPAPGSGGSQPDPTVLSGTNQSFWTNDWKGMDNYGYDPTTNSYYNHVDASGVQEIQAAFGGMEDTLGSIGQVEGELLKQQKSNTNESYSIEHSFCGNIVDQEKTMAQNLQQASS